MPTYKDKATDTWFVKFYSKGWKGENRQVKKQGFKTKKEALDYERNFKMREECNLDMAFGEFFNRGLLRNLRRQSLYMMILTMT